MTTISIATVMLQFRLSMTMLIQIKYQQAVPVEA